MFIKGRFLNEKVITTLKPLISRNNIFSGSETDIA